jgi:hypothetical protein
VKREGEEREMKREREREIKRETLLTADRRPPTAVRNDHFRTTASKRLCVSKHFEMKREKEREREK